MSSASPIAATRGATNPIPSESPADAAGGSTYDSWLATVPAGYVAVTDAAPADSIMDASVHVVTIGALRLWLSRWATRVDKDPARQAAAIREWLAGQRRQDRRIPFAMWCGFEAQRLRRLGIDADVHQVKGTNLCAVVRKVPA